MRTMLAAVLACGVTAGSVDAQTRSVTIDDILDLKAVSGAVLSPDGTRVLYTVRGWEAPPNGPADRRDARTHVWIVPTDGGPARQITFGARGETAPRWSPDGRYISFIAARGTGEGDGEPKPQVHVMRADGGEARRVTDSGSGVLAYAWSPDGARIAFVAEDPLSEAEEAARKRRDDARVYEGDARHRHLWTVEVAENSEARRLTEGLDFSVDVDPPAWSPDGARLAFSAGVTRLLRDERHEVYLVDAAGGTPRAISSNPGRDTNPRWSPDGRWIAWVADPNASAPLPDGTLPSVVAQSHLVLYDVQAGRARSAASREFDLQANTPIWSPDSRRLLFSTGRRAWVEAFAYDVETSRYTSLTERRTLQLGSISADGRLVALTMDTPASPGEVYVTGADFREFRKLTDANPQARAFALGATEVVTWKSRDGQEVEGVLLTPAGYEPGRRYPLLVVAHGGPAGAFVNNYRVGGLEGGQLWAGQGWAVFYPNPRGSTNYGERFLKANVNDWGGGDFADIMSGIDALVGRGIADADKLALIGWSYGGYMTAWSITQTTRFKAAMVGAGLTNLWSMYGTNDIPNVLDGYFGGIAGPERLPLYMERSAMTRIDKVVTPTLVLHGASDERVPIGQGQELHRGLKDRGVPTELVLYPREGHGISEYYHQKDRLTRIQEWITRYTTGGGKKTSSP